MKMTGARFNTVLIAIGLGVSLMSYQNCSGPQGFRFKGQPGMVDGGKGSLQENGGTTTDNPKPTLSLEVGNFQNVVADAAQAPQIFLCVSEIRFEKSTTGADDTRIDMNGVVQNPANMDFLQSVANESKFIALKPQGTVINLVDVPVGNYERVELRLRADCDGISAAVKNANGEILVRGKADMRFKGSVVINGNLSRLVLDMDQMVADLAVAKTPRDVKDALSQESSCGGGD